MARVHETGKLYTYEKNENDRDPFDATRSKLISFNSPLSKSPGKRRSRGESEEISHTLHRT